MDRRSNMFSFAVLLNVHLDYILPSFWYSYNCIQIITDNFMSTLESDNSYEFIDNKKSC